MHSAKDKYYAQYGEDILLSRIFQGKADGVAVEVGAFDGVSGSNTAYFQDIGWTCVLVEPNPALAQAVRNVRPAALVFEYALGAHAEGELVLSIPTGAETLASVSAGSTQRDRMISVSKDIVQLTVKETTLDWVLQESGVDRIEFISIDVEGHEMEVLSGFSLSRWKPRLVIIEDNSSGTSDEILNFMKFSGYVRFRNTGCNDWYCAKSDKELSDKYLIFLTELKKALKGIKKVTFRHGSRIWALLTTVSVEGEKPQR